MATYVPMAGENIVGATENMVRMARELKETVTAKFNDIELTANPGDRPDSIAAFYRNESRLRSEAYRNSPEYIRAEEDERKAREIRDAVLRGALLFAPTHMTVRNEELWRKAVASQKDGYGDRINEYAECWARLMEGRMRNGSSLEDCAEEAGRIADNDGISGFMFGAALVTLRDVWVHGEELAAFYRQLYPGMYGDISASA